jgi:hypothetical protein
MYVVDRNNLGKFTSVGNNIWQELKKVLAGGIWSTPAYFDFQIFYGPKNSPLLAFSVANGRLSSSPTSQSSTQFTTVNEPGPSPIISANGTSNAIVWAFEQNTPGVLHAYPASNLANELYNSNQAPDERDQLSAGNADGVAVVADGKVFVATNESIAIFGLLPVTSSALDGRATAPATRPATSLPPRRAAGEPTSALMRCAPKRMAKEPADQAAPSLRSP